MTTRSSKPQDSPSRVENLEKLLAKKMKVTSTEFDSPLFVQSYGTLMSIRYSEIIY